MTISFTKLFSSITDSSIWSEDSDTRVVWVTMLAMSDQFGRVHAAIPGLAKRAMVTVPKTEEAIQKFLLPDPYSRTKDHEGRRIEVIDGGWRLLNHDHYRDLRSEEDRKEQNRLAQQRRREKLKNVSNSSANVSTGQQQSAESAQADAYTEAYTENKKRAFKFPSEAGEVLDYLNLKAGTRFEKKAGSIQHIIARLNDGATIEQFKAVIDSKVKEWINDPKMKQFIRPSTLFNSEKFHNYLGLAQSVKSESSQPTGVFK